MAIPPAEPVETEDSVGAKQDWDMAMSCKFSLLVLVSVSSNNGTGTLVDATDVVVFSVDTAVWEQDSAFKTSLDTAVTSTSMGCSVRR